MPFVGFQESSKPNESSRDEVPGEGSLNSRLCFIGEAPAANEIRTGRPFVGDAGRVFEHCLHEAGIFRKQCYVTNFIKTQIGKNISQYVGRRGLTDKGLYWRDILAEELANVTTDLVVPLGGPATMALTGADSITNARGYLTNATEHFNYRPVLPSLHPASCLYGGSYINKYYISHDFRKALKVLGDERGVKDHDVAATLFPTTIGEVERMLQEMRAAGIFAFDIEVSNFEVSAISFAASKDVAYSVLLQDQNMWSEIEELQFWRLVADVLEDSGLVKVGQNLIFDIHFLMTHQGIFVRGPIIDTMVGHHIVYPDFLKGLRFLASIYTNVPSWKDMVKFKGGNIKKES